MSIDPRRALATLAVVVLLGGVGALQVAAQGDQRCFLETNLCISGPIRTYWERNGGLPVFGYPITDELDEVLEGKRTAPPSGSSRFCSAPPTAPTPSRSRQRAAPSLARR